MAMNVRGETVFAAGLLAGAIAVAAVFGIRGDDKPSASMAKSAPALPATAIIGASAAPRGDTSVDCSFDPIVTAVNTDDGKLGLREDLAGSQPPTVASFILAGKEASAAGHLRDAETNFLMACRAAEALKPADTMLLADAHYQLGRHYAAVAQPDARRRSELLDRAGALYAASLESYRGKYGDNHEKTRFAAAGVAAVEQAGGSTSRLAQAMPPRNIPSDNSTAGVKPPTPPGSIEVAQAPQPAAPAVKAPEPAPAAPLVKAPQPAPAAPVLKAPPPPPTTAIASAAPGPERLDRPPTAVAGAGPNPAPTVARTRPSFDCSKARSTTEKIICGDEELAQADRELGRLHARAKDAAPDRRAFQQRSDEAWSRRESTCTDRDCLRDWYAQRRSELQAQALAQPEPKARTEPVARARTEPVARTEPARPEASEQHAEAPPRPAVTPARRAEAPAPVRAEAHAPARADTPPQVEPPAQASGDANADSSN